MPAIERNDIPMAYRETYRGVGFHLTLKGYWLFDDICPSGKHWSRYTERHMSGLAITSSNLRDDEHG